MDNLPAIWVPNNKNRIDGSRNAFRVNSSYLNYFDFTWKGERIVQETFL